MLAATRREFLGDLGHSMLLATFGSTLLGDLGAATRPLGPPSRSPLLPRRGDLEELVRAMQSTRPDELQPRLVAALKDGTQLATLVAAGAIANARTFGGGDYEGYHAFMALLPAYAMRDRMAPGLEALPVLKVLYRNAARIQTAGGGREALGSAPAIEASATGQRPAAGSDDAAALQERVRAVDLAGADQVFAHSLARGQAPAFDDLQALVEDDLNVHRIVLAWRAWDMLALVDADHAKPLLRQFVRFCVEEERNRRDKGRPEPSVRQDVPRLLEQYRLRDRPAGTRQPDDHALEQLAATVFAGERVVAAEAVAAALADGIAPDAVAEAIALGANALLLHDTGKQRVHGASVGLHACDAANAWRNVALASASHRAASLVTAAYHTGGQSQQVGAAAWSFADALERQRERAPEALLRAAADAIEHRDQQSACAAVQLYGDGGHPPQPVFDLLLRYAVSEDGALHAEKFFHTAQQEFGRTRAPLRGRWLVALARVTASEFGEPAPGVAAARTLLTS